MSKRMRPALMAALSLLLGSAPARAVEEPKYEMTTYQFVMLMEGSPAPADGPERERIQKAHLDFMRGLIEDGRGLILGHVEDGGSLRGVVVLNAATPAEAEAIMKEDPWVRSGVLRPEVHPWWAAKGIIRRAPDLSDPAACWLGLLKRPPDAPQLPEERLKELQAGHMANIKGMADSGDLVIAGPMGDQGALRGIFVFRTPEESRVRELAARDPSIQAGRLALDLYRWRVPRGALPERP